MSQEKTLAEKLARLAEAQQLVSSLVAEVKVLEADAIAEMAETGISALEVNDYKFLLKQKRAGRAIANAPLSEAVLELRSALQAEVSELTDVNKSELYQLQQTVRMAELRRQQLLTNDFTVDIADKLAIAEAEAASQGGTEAPQMQYALQMQKMPSRAEHSKTNTWIGLARDSHIADCADVEPLTFRQITSWLKQTGLTLPNDAQAIDALWQMRRQQHIDFWQRRGKCMPVPAPTVPTVQSS